MRSLSTKRPHLRALGAGALAFITSANFTSIHAQELNPIVVVSSRTSEPLSDSLPSVAVIEKADIEKFRYADLYELLSGQAGLQVARSGGVGNPISVYMRGASSTQTLVLIDGIPFAAQGAIGASSPLEAIPVSQVERVEILRGNASAVYGPGAAGGVIHIITQAPTSTAERVDTKAELSSFNTRAIQAAVTKNIGDGQLSFSVSDDRSDGISTLTPSRYANNPGVKINPDRNGFDLKSMGLGWRQNLSGRTQLALNYLNTATFATYDNPYSSAVTDRWASKSALEVLGAQVSHRVTHDWKTSLSYGTSTSKFSTLTNGVLNAGYGTSDTRQQQLKWDNVVALGTATQLSFGYANQRSELDTARTDYAYDSNFNATPIDAHLKKSIRSERVWSGLSQSAGAWSWRANLSREQLPGPHSANTYLVGAGYALNANYKVTLTRSTAVQAPTVGQLSDVAYGGNAGLNPERSVNTEAGLQFKGDDSLWRVVLFDVKYKDMIAASSNLVADPFWAAQYITQLENLNSATNKGVEVSYTKKWAAWGLQLAYTAQNPENLSSTRPIQNRAKRFGSATLSHYADEKTTLNAKMIASSERWTPMIGSFSSSALVPGYAVLNLSTEHKIRPNLKLTFSVMNALDKTYFHLDGYNNLPRTYHVGLKFAHR